MVTPIFSTIKHVKEDWLEREFRNLHSAACNNINLICDKLKCDKTDIENIQNKCYKMINAAVRDIRDEPELLKCGNIKYLLHMRDNSSSNLTYNEIKTLLDFFCTS